uniref:Non-specific lipid-transfer protein n=2 Tax=Aegilops tauschii subsp. strangulata TaxID=200361 RepID=A0A453D1A5_AEGTS
MPRVIHQDGSPLLTRETWSHRIIFPIYTPLHRVPSPPPPHMLIKLSAPSQLHGFQQASRSTRSSMARVALVAVFAVLAALAVAEMASGAVTCGDVTSAVAPCMSYATGKASAPSGACCSGVRTLNAKASTPADRKAACNCLKNLAGSGISMGNAANIPGKCGVSVSFPINTKTNCNNLH